MVELTWKVLNKGSQLLNGKGKGALNILVSMQPDFVDVTVKACGCGRQNLLHLEVKSDFCGTVSSQQPQGARQWLNLHPRQLSDCPLRL